MKPLFNIRVPSIDLRAIQDTIRNTLSRAGLDPHAGPLRGVAESIRHALAAAGLSTRGTVAPEDDEVIDVVARVVPREGSAAGAAPPGAAESQAQPQLGTFTAGAYANAAGTRTYKVYVPARVGASPALVVMLHGCQQSADDFAKGTQMNQLAELHGFLVVYPEQANGANSSKCWNWFNAQDQIRASGEPSLIAGLVREVAQRHHVDLNRIYVAGLSAGAAMAVILGETYPDLFSAVGAHSGLPYRSAHDIPSAMAAMKAGRSAMHGVAFNPRRASGKSLAQAVPTIVFHGDRDHTVQQENGAEIVQQAANAHSAAQGGGAMSGSTERGTSKGGRSYTRTVYADAAGRAQIESWTLHGGSHAWAGGHPSGSFTDGRGPDASAEMLRFFLSQAKPGTAA